MKKFLNSLLGVIVFIPLVFISCGEKDVNPPPKDMCPNLPGVQTSSADCPPVPTGEKPVVTASNPAKGWFNGNIVGTFSVTTSDPITSVVVKANGVVIPEAGYSYTLNNVTGPVSVEIAVTNKNGTTTAYANADVYSLVKTNYCSTGDWKLNKTFINGQLMPATCEVYKFSMVDDIMKATRRYSLCEGMSDATGPCTLDEANSKITFGALTYNYSDLSGTFVKLSYTNHLGQAVVQEFGH